MQTQFRSRPGYPGGIAGYPWDQLAQEVAYVAYHFHWSRDDVFELSHRERRMWVEEISKINERINRAREG